MNGHKKKISNFFKWIFWTILFLVTVYFLADISTNQSNPPSGYNESTDIQSISNITNIPVLKKDIFSNATFPHWDHIPLTYKIDNNCNQRLINLTKLAFKKIKNETGGLVYYIPANDTPDLSIHCKSGNYSSITYTIEDTNCLMKQNGSNIISYADINIYGQGMVCGTGYPATEVHELLHTLGFIHSPHEDSIMYPFSADSSAECKTIHIDNEYISCLKNTYSDNNLSGNCSNIDTIINEGESNISCGVCQDNWYSAKGSLGCCPEPNMIIDSEGYCN